MVYFERAKLESFLQCSIPTPVTAAPNKDDAKKLEGLCGCVPVPWSTEVGCMKQCLHDTQ